MVEVIGSSPTAPTKKGLSEHCRIKKRYSDSFYFTKRRDAMKSVLFSYIILLDEAKERIEEKLIIEGGFQAAFYIG